VHRDPPLLPIETTFRRTGELLCRGADEPAPHRRNPAGVVHVRVLGRFWDSL